MLEFPIDHLKTDILDALDQHDWLIIRSSPGSGKTTRVPVFLSEKYNSKIYILEPRKLAAKLASTYVRKSFKDRDPLYVGHIFRFENSTNKNSKIIFLTEGSFLNILKENRNLTDTDVVILDEFHERHLNTDMALSFLKEIKKVNPTLKIIIMSATLDSDKLETFVGEKPKTISLNLSKHNIEINHLPNDTLILKESLEKKVIDAISESINVKGHVLVFLPGMYEINLVKERIIKAFHVEPYILHGDLEPIDFEAEDFGNIERKKIILSTNIAESSVTIPGVRIVIDSGLKREATLNPVTRLKHIELNKISQSSAIQRAHRSNREGNGTVYRLYSKFDFDTRLKFDDAEILRTDLSELILKTQEIFQKNPNDLDFLDELNQKELEKSKNFLTQISLITENGLTKLGIKVNRIPQGPRLSTILVLAAEAGAEIFDEVLNYISEWQFRNQKEQFYRQVKTLLKPVNERHDLSLEKIFLQAHVDQIAKIRMGKDLELIHQNGEVYKISHHLTTSIDPKHELWIILDIDNKNNVSKLLPIEEEWLYELEYFPLEEKYEYQIIENRIFKTTTTKIGAITLETNKKSCNQMDASLKQFLSKHLLSYFQELFNENEFSRLMIFEKHTQNKIANFNFQEWINHEFDNIIFDESDFKDQLKINYLQALFNYLNSDNLFDLEKDLPLFMQFSDKRKSKIIYDSTNGVFVESFIQDFYGLNSAPSILKGREKLTIRLLGPHKRPIQVTNDLNSFWDKAYKEMFSELKRDYPRHYWPDNPKSAKPFLLLRQVQ